MPDDAGRRVLMDGRLDLEQQKKRAKELLKGVQAGDADALARLGRAHPEGARLRSAGVQLADAQLAVARENGFASWAQMKRRTEALSEARAAARRGDLAPDAPDVLHVRCGHDLKRALKRAGFVGGFHAFTDPLCQGPVRDLPTPQLIAERAAFVSKAYGLYADIAQSRLEGEYAALRVDGVSSVCLWFEHDSYDQLILAYVLTALADWDGPTFLVCVDRVPGVARFKGLGQLAPEVVRLLWQGRAPVSEPQFDLGRAVWAALTSRSPQALHAIGAAGTPAVPPMAGALMRHLRELPSTRNGLGLTEQLTLDVLAEAGALAAPALFETVQAREPLPFLGDTMYWAVLADLEREALIDAPPAPGDWHESWARRSVRLTKTGEAVRTGAADRVGPATPVRWWGGVRLDPAAPMWRWDDRESRPVQVEGGRP